MKKIYAFTLLFLFLTHYLCFSQAKNYFVDGSRWVYQTNESVEINCDPDIAYDFEQQYLIQGDTTINGVAYKKLFTNVMTTVTTCPNEKQYISYDSTGGQYLRYDSLNERVFFLDSATSTEKLLYDFNLSTGDSVPDAYKDNYNNSYSSELNGGNGFSNAVIDSVGTINVFGFPARVFYIYQGFDYFPEDNYIIEGIGGSNGFWFDNRIDPGVSSGGIFGTYLECFQNGDSILFGYGSCPYLNIPTGVKNITAQDIEIIIYPNPATDQLTIHASSFHNEAVTVSVMNVLGQETSPPAPLQRRGEDAVIDISKLPAGMYFLQLKSESGSVVKKFVKE